MKNGIRVMVVPPELVAKTSTGGPLVMAEAYNQAEVGAGETSGSLATFFSPEMARRIGEAFIEAADISEFGERRGS